MHHAKTIKKISGVLGTIKLAFASDDANWPYFTVSGYIVNFFFWKFYIFNYVEIRENYIL